MNSDVFLSLLALDSYNHGYGQNVGGISDSGQIGNATIIAQSSTAAGSAEVDAGFYAIAYEWNGQKIISYRGTNFEFDSVFEFLGSPIYNDVFKGWTLGAGFSSASQGQLAANENSLTSIAA